VAATTAMSVESDMNELSQTTRRDRLIQIANLLVAHERATPLARRVLDCRLALLESGLISAPEAEAASSEAAS
jgi:hypothetical protein